MWVYYRLYLSESILKMIELLNPVVQWLHNIYMSYNYRDSQPSSFLWSDISMQTAPSPARVSIHCLNSLSVFFNQLTDQFSACWLLKDVLATAARTACLRSKGIPGQSPTRCQSGLSWVERRRVATKIQWEKSCFQTISCFVIFQLSM